MINCVIFDMDGVVVNTEPICYIANQEFYKKLGITVPDDVYATFTGNSDKNIIQKLKELYNLEESVENLLEESYTYYFEAFKKTKDLELMPGVKDLIIDLHKNGIKLILASSATHAKINQVFDRFGLNPYFEDKISGEDFEFSKPNPAIFNEANKRSGLPKEECIIFEDSTNGIKAAKAAGIFCIGYDNGHAMMQETSLADMVINDFTDLNAEKIKHIKEKRAI